MSKFGKKALIWWDYQSGDRNAFNSTPKDIQLKILEKWYPIGMMVGLTDNSFGSLYKYEIVEYTQHSTFWNVGIMLKSEYSLLNGVKYNRNPLGLYPSPEWEKQLKRQYKLDRLL
jgi:hypothetical protein